MEIEPPMGQKVGGQHRASPPADLHAHHHPSPCSGAMGEKGLRRWGEEWRGAVRVRSLPAAPRLPRDPLLASRQRREPSTWVKIP